MSLSAAHAPVNRMADAEGAETTVNVLGGGDTSVPESVRVALDGDRYKLAGEPH